MVFSFAQETRLQLFTLAVRLLENYVTVDFASSLREFLLGQVYNEGLSDINKIDWTVEGELQWGEDADLSKVVSKWYSDFVSKRLATPGLCYSVNRYRCNYLIPPQVFVSHESDNRKAFISRADVRAALPFRPEEYVDLSELQAVVRLVGPYGVRAIHREVMKFITSSIPSMKDILAVNRKTLSDINSNYHKEIGAHLKSLRDLDTFINRSIAIGNALQFRQLLLEAQRSVAERDIPYLSHTVSAAFEQVRHRPFLLAIYDKSGPSLTNAFLH